MGSFNARHHFHPPPMIHVEAKRPGITLSLGGKSRGQASHALAASVDIAATAWGDPISDDARCVYEVCVNITDESTRQVVGWGPDPHLPAAQTADWQRLYEALKGIKRISCHEPTWMCDNGCVGDHGSIGVWVCFQVAADQPLLSEQPVYSGKMLPFPADTGHYEYPASDSELFREALESTGLGEDLRALLETCMLRGGEFAIEPARLQCRKDLSQSKQFELFSRWDLLNQQ